MYRPPSGGTARTSPQRLAGADRTTVDRLTGNRGMPSLLGHPGPGRCMSCRVALEVQPLHQFRTGRNHRARRGPFDDGALRPYPSRGGGRRRGNFLSGRKFRNRPNPGHAFGRLTRLDVQRPIGAWQARRERLPWSGDNLARLRRRHWRNRDRCLPWSRFRHDFGSSTFAGQGRTKRVWRRSCGRLFLGDCSSAVPGSLDRWWGLISYGAT